MTTFLDTQTYNYSAQQNRRVAASEFDAKVRMAHDFFMPSVAGRGIITSLILPAGHIRIYKNLSYLNTPAAWGQTTATVIVGFAAYTTGVIRGAVTTNGTAVTWVNGDTFGMGWDGSIIISGVSYTVSSVTDPYHMVITPTAGVQSQVAYKRTEQAETADTNFFWTTQTASAALNAQMNGFASDTADFITLNGLTVTFTVGVADMAVTDCLEYTIAYAECVGG